MPSNRVLEEKKQIVADLVENLKSAAAGVLVDYKGITVEDDTKLRKQLREAGVHYGVYKNTLIRFAFNEVGYSELDECLNGTTALAYSEDLTAGAKILCDFAKDHENFTVKAGFLEGEPLDIAGVQALAKLPSRDQLLSMLCSALNGNIRGLAVVLNAVKEKAEEQPA